MRDLAARLAAPYDVDKLFDRALHEFGPIADVAGVIAVELADDLVALPVNPGQGLLEADGEILVI